LDVPIGISEDNPTYLKELSLINDNLYTILLRFIIKSFTFEFYPLKKYFSCHHIKNTCKFPFFS
jgi:hypothetical protein